MSVYGKNESTIPHPKVSLKPSQINQILVVQRESNSQGVVNICSPVKTALAPAMKHIVCSDSPRVLRPAASLIIVPGRTMRAVAIVRTRVWYGIG